MKIKSRLDGKNGKKNDKNPADWVEKVLLENGINEKAEKEKLN